MMNGMKCIKQRSILPGPSLALVTRVVLLSMVLFVFACAPNLYSVHIKYEPSKDAINPIDVTIKQPVTIAAINDARPGGDDLLLGHVITSGGSRTPVIPRKNKLSKAVSESIKDYMQRAGYHITDQIPVWDLKENNLNKEWGRIVIGGSIDQVEVICKDNIPVKRYNAEVKLTLLFADVQKGRIFYTVSATSKTSLEHVRLSAEILEQQINGALSSTIEDIFRGDTVQSKIKEVLGNNP